MNKTLLNRIFVTSIIFLLALSSLAVLKVEAQEENIWTSLAPMQVERLNLGVIAENGKIYAIGGWDGSNTNINEMYNPTENQWTTKTSMPTSRSNFGIASIQNKIYAIGGQNENQTGVNEVYDSQTDTWTTKEPMPTPRSGIEANVVENKIYVIGGKTDSSYTGINEVYDPQTDTWITKTPMPVPTSGYASVAINNSIYIFGGYDGSNYVELTQVYNTETDSWSNKSPLSTTVMSACAGVTTGVFSPKRIYVIGGHNSIGTVNLNQVYNIETDVWNTGALMPKARSSFGLAVVDDRLYAIGGTTVAGGISIHTFGDNQQYTPFLTGSLPEISITSPENKIYNQTTTIPLEFTVNEPVSWMGYSLDGRANVTVTENTNLTILMEGTHTLGLYVRDMVGDEGSSIVTFTVDVNPPVVFVLSPENKTYGDSNVLLNVEFEEPISNMQYSLDGFENVTFTEDITLSELEVGPHNITVYATDLVGHTGVSETIYFSIEPFPTNLVIGAVAVIAVVGFGILAYFKKNRGKKL